MKEYEEIVVTPEHFLKGVPGDPYSCPAALAINEKLPEGWKSVVGKNKITATGHTRNIRGTITNYLQQWNTPGVIRLLIRKYDKGKIGKKEMSPVKFKLEKIDLNKFSTKIVSPEMEILEIEQMREMERKSLER